MTRSPLSAFRLVLVRPKFAANVGACARLAANFDVRDVRVVAPGCDWRGPEARRLAMAPADRYLDGAREHATIGEAVADCAAAVGFTRRHGEHRRARRSFAALPVLARADGPIALVFGNEEIGLTQGELAACTHAAAIPTAGVMPSMNLSHAVGTVLARLYDARSEGSLPPGPARTYARATVGELEALFAQWRETLVDVGLTRAGNPDRLLAQLRRILAGADLTGRDVRVFRAFLSKTRLKISGSSRRPRRTGPGRSR
jgi:TrmH family RNA methyltransferase